MNKRLFLAAPAGLLALAACSPPVATPPPPVVTTTAASAAAPTTTTTSPAPTTTTTATATPVASDNGCKVNPATAPVPTADPYGSVPAADQVQVSLSGVPSGVVKVDGSPVEVDMTVCNNSPVSYPNVGFVFVLDHCSCVAGPSPFPRGVVQRFDPATLKYVDVPVSYAGGGMDFLGTSTAQQPLPKGKSVTLRYRFVYDMATISGKGAVRADVVTPDGPHDIGGARLSFTVSH
jgi:hypothetical protein